MDNRQTCIERWLGYDGGARDKQFLLTESEVLQKKQNFDNTKYKVNQWRLCWICDIMLQVNEFSCSFICFVVFSVLNRIMVFRKS